MCCLVSSVALIGSFRQHYGIVLDSLSAFTSVGLIVTTPKGTGIVKYGIPFVRFESDNPEWVDEMVQVAALHRILRADFVFTVVPNGYVGRTTCYEVGRVIQANKPVYFSARPDDLPLCIPDSHICSATHIADEIRRGIFRPEMLHAEVSSSIGQLEQDLINGRYKNI
jgi:hypothetical protein